LRLFVGDAGTLTDDLSLGEDRFLLWPLSSPVGLLASALVVSVAMLPPSFSHRSSIFFFRRLLAIGSGIVVSSVSLVLYLSFASHQRRDERSFETIVEFTGFGLLGGGPKCPQSSHAAQKLMDLGYTTNDSTTGLLPKYFPSVTVSQARANAKII
jgi:hypothetical protein